LAECRILQWRTVVIARQSAFTCDPWLAGAGVITVFMIRFM